MTPLSVDVTDLTLKGLRAARPDVRFVTETPDDLADVVPLCRVVRTGGPDDLFTLDMATLVLHCFNAHVQDDGPSRTRALAYDLIPAMYGLVDQVIDGAVVTRVRKFGGPYTAAYENTNVRHEVLTFQVCVTVV